MEARVSLQWRNPKIHDVDRVKSWLACDEHLEYLKEFLLARSFPLRIVPIEQVANENE